ncbi:MAG: histone H1-like repetitive region-containing protein [Burkholderiaceae bacterium]|nr:histone H1-like repetitive region-containing protein [Burkholderiaceae bacterium]
MENVVIDPVNTPANAVQPSASADLASSVAAKPKKAVAKKAVAKKAVAKKAVAKKAVAKKAVAKKAVAKKAVAKKAVAKKATAKKAVAKKATVKKPVAKKATAKQPSVANASQVAPVVANPTPKAKKVKLVRDSFAMPGHEYQVLQDIKKAALKAGIELKKSDLLRIGVGMLKNFSVTQLDKARAALTKLSAGRPKK